VARWAQCHNSLSFAGGQATRWPGAISVSGWRRAPTRSRLGVPPMHRNAVVHGPGQPRGPAGPAKYTGLRADQTWCPRRARRRPTFSFRQVRGTDLSGLVTRIAQRQDSDSFSQAAAPSDQRGAGAAGTDAGSAPRSEPDYPWPNVSHSRRAGIDSRGFEPKGR
jgi:hypothetical protein